jgi:RNA polymerase-binding transcription factor DksA
MKQEDGYCDDCGAELGEVGWMTLAGEVLCAECGVARPIGFERKATKPEARDDGR